MAYRKGPTARGLPFPRRNLGLYTAVALVAAVLVAFAPIPLLCAAHGWRTFKDGGVGMYVLLLMSLSLAGGMGVLGGRVVRGGSAAAIIVALPAVPVTVASVFVRYDYASKIDWMLTNESVDPSAINRHVWLAEGLAA